MAATVTLVATGSWTDFSVKTEKTFTTSADINIGDRIFFGIASTVADTTWPPALGTWGGIMGLTDAYGHVYARDTPVAAAGTTADASTPELWSAYAKRFIPSGTVVTFNVLPGTRGLSAYIKIFKVSGLAEAVDGSVSPKDKATQVDESSTPWAGGSTGTLAQADELVVAVHAAGGAPTGWFTDTAGFTKLGSDQTGSAPGSPRGLSILTLETAATTSVASTGTITGGVVGQSAVASYKVAGAAVTPQLDLISLVQVNNQQTLAATSRSVTLTATVVGNFMVICASAWKTGGADPGLTISDSGNVWTAAQATVPASSSGARAYIWTAPVTSGGTRTVTVTANASSFISVSGSEWSAPAGYTFSVDQKNKNSGTSASGTPGSVTVSAANELYVAAMTCDAVTDVFNPDNWTELWDISSGQTLCAIYQTSVSGQTTNPAFAFVTGSTTFAGQIVTIKANAPAPAGGPIGYRIPNRFVGPMALRYRFRRAAFPQQIPTVGGLVTFDATVVGAAAVSADNSPTRAFASTVVGAATVTADNSPTRSFSSTVAGAGVVSTSNALTRAFASAVAGAAAVTADNSVARDFSATVVGAGVVGVSFSTGGGGLVTFDTAIAGAAVVGADMAVLRPFAAPVGLLENMVRNPSAETGLTDFSAVNGATGLSSSLTSPKYGTHSVQFSTPGSVAGEGVEVAGGTAASPLLPVTPGLLYTFVYRATAGSTTNLRAQIDWYDASDALISSTQGTPTSVFGGTDVPVTGQAPATAVYAKLRAVTSGTSAGTFQTDGFRLTQEGGAGANFFGYFDGDGLLPTYTNGVWEGTPHASKSLKAAAAVKGGMTLTKGFAAAPAGSAAITANDALTSSFSTTVAGAAVVSGAVTITSPGFVTFSATITGAGVVTADTHPFTPFSSTVAGTAVVTAGTTQSKRFASVVTGSASVVAYYDSPGPNHPLNPAGPNDTMTLTPGGNDTITLASAGNDTLILIPTTKDVF